MTALRGAPLLGWGGWGRAQGRREELGLLCRKRQKVRRARALWRRATLCLPAGDFERRQGKPGFGPARGSVVLGPHSGRRDRGTLWS